MIVVSDQFRSYALSKLIELLFTDCCQLTCEDTFAGNGLEWDLQENGVDRWHVFYFQGSSSVFEEIIGRQDLIFFYDIVAEFGD